MRVLLPLFLFAAYAQAQLILGALALIELTIEVLEAAEVVATIDDSVDLAVTGAEAAETAAVEATVTNVGTTVTRAGEAGIEYEGDAAMTGFGRVSREGPGFTQGTFTYRQQFPLGVGPDRRSTVNPQISLSWGARTNGVRSRNTNSIQLPYPPFPMYGRSTPVESVFDPPTLGSSPRNKCQHHCWSYVHSREGTPGQ